MIIDIMNDTQQYTVSDQLESKIEIAILKALEIEGYNVEGEVSVLFVNNEDIKNLNHKYREKDAVTDVLSFQQYDNIVRDGFDEDYLYLGDVVISLERAEEQAQEYGHTFEREVIYLTIHSILHLLGYDHIEEDDKVIMREHEKNIMKELELFK